MNLAENINGDRTQAPTKPPTSTYDVLAEWGLDRLDAVVSTHATRDDMSDVRTQLDELRGLVYRNDSSQEDVRSRVMYLENRVQAIGTRQDRIENEMQARVTALESQINYLRDQIAESRR